MRRAAALVVALSACQAGGDRPGVVVLPGMATSIPYDSYDRHPVIGQTLRTPPEGAVSYQALPFSFGAGTDEAARAGRELTNPFQGAAATQQLPRAKKVFDTFCLVCHGPAGQGDGPIIGGGRFPNPPSLLSPRARSLPDGHLYHVISRGQGLMSSYAVQVQPEDRWRAIVYVRWLQQMTEKAP